VQQLAERVAGLPERHGVAAGRVRSRIADRRGGVVRAPGVAALEVRRVVAGVDPAPQLGGPDHGERVGLGLQQAGLEERLAQVAALVVLQALCEELRGVEVLEVTSARELHVHAERGLRVLRRQQAGAVGGELGLARPLHERDQDDPEGDAAGRNRAEQAAEAQHPLEHGLVDRVPAHRVPQLVPDHEPQLLLAEQVDEGRVEDDHGLVHADAGGVEERTGAHVHLGDQRRVQRGTGLLQQSVQALELPIVHAHRRPQQLQPQSALAHQPGHRLEQRVEPPEPPHRHQRPPVRRVLPCPRADPGQGGAAACRWVTGGLGHAGDCAL